MGAAAVGAQVAGAGLQAYGAYSQGMAQNAYYRYTAAGDRQAAGMALAEGDRESRGAQDEGLFKTQELNRKVSETEGAQTAAAAANGTAGSVTAQDISVDTQRKSLLDRMAIRYNADRTSWAAKNNAALKAWQLNKEADEAEVAGEAAKRAGKIGAFTSLLGGASQVGSSWSKLSRTAPAS